MARAIIYIILFLTWSKDSYCFTRIDPLVETNQGLIRGVRATDGNYSKFLGIPYATVDKDNPFGISTPQAKFNTVFVANNESAVCPQYDTYEKRVIGTLDCLHMNIFVPDSASTRNPLPVLVWIYGGRFERGLYQSTRVAPQFLLKHDIIVATFNYRTGPYGFMCLDTPEVPGNAGLKDQELALKWIKNNIKFFGGDVEKITLGGQSAGSVSVDFHLLYDKENYFNQVIMKSGTAFCPWAIIDSNRNEPLQLAEALGYSTNDFNDAISFLSRTDPILVIAAKQRLATDSRPCVEKTFEGVESFIYDYPVNLKVPRAKTMPIIVGYTDDELIGEYYRFPTVFYEDPDLFTTETSLFFNFGEEAKEMGDFFKHFYVGDIIGEETKMNIIDFESDLRFNYPTQIAINNYLENGATKVYHYIFSYIGNRNIKVQNNITVGGAAHGDDIRYLFDYENLRDAPMSSEDQIIVERLALMYTNFVKYGNPTPKTTDLLPVKWIPVTKDYYNYLNVNNEMTIGTRPFHERLTFWDLFYNMNKRALKGYRES